ncbi:CHAT domain-containing protein [Actinomadura sp. KC06]|uniref:CHAT domain-containing protein n=1 Tax=Actinomadura sp. KC06 TaxID=2530369 RepID=UPI00104316F8|nr:CHAT domain-containing protein [Actinomadura sp. KC06]TDD40214.1 CHAT domain-containing protein [Actinomadura sp. KC06]
MTGAPDGRQLFLQALDGDVDVLDEAIELLREASALEDLGEALFLRFWRALDAATGDDDAMKALDDLDEAIETMRDALANASGEDRRTIAASCGDMLHTRFRLHRRDEDDLHAAIDLLAAATEGPEPDPLAAADLADALADRYDVFDAEDDRDQAIRWYRTALDALFLTRRRDVLVNVQRLAELMVDKADETMDAAGYTAAIGYAERALAVLPDDAETDRAFVLYLLGWGRLRRAVQGTADPRAELADAVGCLRRALAMPPIPEPSPDELTAVLGLALSSWVGADVEWGTGAAEETRDRADEVIRLLTCARDALHPEHPFRAQAWFQLGMTLALRFLAFGGDAGDRAAALAELDALAASPGIDADLADVCRFNLARVLVVEPMPSGLLQSLGTYDYDVHRRMAEFGSAPDSGPRPEDAERALANLDMISAERGAVPPEEVLELRAYATLYLRPDGPTEEDVERAVRDGEAAFRQSGQDDPDRGMRLGLLAQWLSYRADRSGRPDDEERVVETLARAAEELDPDHRFRPALLGMLGESLGGSWADEPGSAERRDAVVALLERVLRQMPDGHPSRAQTLTHLGRVLMGHAKFDHSPERFERVRGLLREAVDRPAAGPENEAVNHYLLARVDQVEAYLGGDTRRLDGVADRLKHAAALVPEGHWLRITILNALSSLYGQRHDAEGGLEFLDAADHYAELVVRAGRESGDTSSDEVLMSERHLAISPVFRNPRQVTREVLDQAIERLEALSARTDVAADLAFARFFRARVGSGGMLNPQGLGGDTGETAAVAEMLAASLKGTGTDNTGYPLQLALAGNLKVGAGYSTRDLRTLDEGLGVVSDAYGLVQALPPGRRWEPAFAGVLGMLGMGLILRHELTGERADLSNGIDRLEAARGAMTGVALAFAPVETLGNLARAYHQRNDRSLKDRRRAVRLGLEALGERAAAVLLQAGPQRAFEMAFSVAAEAVEVARWALGEGLADAAVEALERGRATVLHAATTDSGVPEMLRRAGLADLAEEWEDAPHTATEPAPWNLRPGAGETPDVAEVLARLPESREPSDLRHRVLTAIEGTEVERSLLAPPSVSDIAGALKAAGADALVYLLARDRHGPGTAVVVDAAGAVREVPLPRLIAGPNSRVDAFATAQRDLVQAGPADEKRIRRRWTHALGDLCDWAWEAAMEEVLAAVPGGRPARVVLVPVGGLGQVPWHAARRRVADGRWRYACQDAVISYAASARQFADACTRGRLPPRDAPALVRVGGSALYWASKEIEEIHRRQYPHGVLLGGRRRGGPRSPDATKDNVSGLLPRRGSGGASLLHLGCHAHPAPRPVDAALALLRGEELSMSEVLERARARPPGSPGGLVVLAACGSDLTATDHDEALTLAAAFLAAGASGAVGARWPVDDVPTALLMAMFHHYLNSGYDDPARALRAAQLWMLDPARRLPAEADPKLADETALADLAAPAAWAAFTCQGR